MRVAVYGTGGAGGYFGAQLARTGEDVSFIARGQHLRAIKAQGLSVETPAGEIVIKPAKATDPSQIGLLDVVILGAKAMQVEEAARNMRPIIGPATFVVPVQSGVEAASQLAARIAAGHVLGGLCGTTPAKIRSISTATSSNSGSWITA